jgi:L-aminopeptidase/D-esterase-like protein
MLGAMAADCVARAIARGVYAAQTLGQMTGYASLYGA